MFGAIRTLLRKLSQRVLLCRRAAHAYAHAQAHALAQHVHVHTQSMLGQV